MRARALALVAYAGAAVLAIAAHDSAAPAGSENAGAWTPSVRVGNGMISGLAVSPRAQRIVYASVFGHGVFKSTDGGRTWRRLAAPGKRFWSVPVNPQRPATVYVGVMGAVSTSRDAGATWSRRIRCCGIEVFVLAFDPRDAQVVIAGGDGLAKSGDGGRTWVEMGRKAISGSHVNVLATDPRSPDTIYAGVGGGGSSGPGEGLVSGVFKTTDGGTSWRRAGLAGQNVRALAIDPQRPWLVYSATMQRGVFSSADAGGTWRRASAGLGGCNVLALALDPAHSQTLYAVTSPRAAGETCGVYRSTDGARSWSAFSDGLDDQDVTELVVSSDGRMLYAGTSGGRVAVLNRSAPPWTGK